MSRLSTIEKEVESHINYTKTNELEEAMSKTFIKRSTEEVVFLNQVMTALLVNSLDDHETMTHSNAKMQIQEQPRDNREGNVLNFMAEIHKTILKSDITSVVCLVLVPESADRTKGKIELLALSSGSNQDIAIQRQKNILLGGIEILNNQK